MTPADLAELLKTTAAAVLAEHGLDTAALPATVTVERPRNPEHGDYATNLALQLAKKVGANPRELAGWLAAALADARTASPRPTSPGPASSTCASRPRRRASSSTTSSPRARTTATPTALDGQKRQPRVRLRQPDRARSTSAAPAGPPSATRWAGCWHAGRRGRARVLLQRPRRPDRPVRQLADRRRQGRADARGRLRGRLHRRHRRPGARQGPRRAEPARRRDARDVPRHRRRPDVRPHQAVAARVRHRLRRLHPRRLDAHLRPRRAGHRQAARDRQHLREGRRSWLRTTDFGDDKDRVVIKSDGNAGLHRRRPRLLPGQARSAASTCASTCSAPTTTATSPG